MVKIIIALIFLTLSAYAKYPYWLRYSVKLVSEFEVPNTSTPYYVEGYGLVMNENLILTSASNVYRTTKVKDIVLYHTEVLGEPIACLSHAKILALDDNLDVAVLEAERFTDIYCNVLPESNFRTLSFAETYLNLMRISDKAFADLISYFENVAEPTIICMFGDHQPKLNDNFFILFEFLNI